MSISKTHSIVYNKYPVFKDHLLVITRAYENQSIRLTANDLIVTYQTLFAVKGFAFYNSSKVAGASQEHKHLQVLGYENFDNDFFKQIRKSFEHVQLTDKEEYKQVQCWVFEEWIYAGIKFRKVGSKDTQEEYAEYLKKVYELGMGLLGQYHNTTDYNLVMGEDYLLVVPRSQEKFQGKVSLNGFALIGSLAATSNEKAALMAEANYRDIFNEIIYRKESL